MELKHLRSFLAVAETLNFRTAANALHLSQPALSKQIQQLEEEIGVLLFRRERPHVSLTVAAEAFRVRANELVVAAQAAVAETRAVEAGIAGTLAIGFVAQAAFAALPQLAKRIKQELPRVDLILREMPGSTILKALESRSIDLALTQTAPVGAGLRSKVVLREQLMLVHSKTHKLSQSKTVTLKEFRNEIFFLPERENSSGIWEIILTNLARHGAEPAHAAEIDRVQTAICLAAANLGVALVPESAKLMSMKGAQFRRLKAPVIPVETRLVWRNRDPPPILKALQAVLSS